MTSAPESITGADPRPASMLQPATFNDSTEDEAAEVKDSSGEEVVLAEVGERVKLARQSASMTQTLLAEVLSVTPTAISYWESGKRDMGVAGLLRIAEACRVPASTLLPAGPAPSPEPSGRYGRVEMPGYRENEGWITEETRFGLQVAVVRDREGTETAAISMGPLCRVVWLHPAAPEPLAALPPGRPVDGACTRTTSGVTTMTEQQPEAPVQAPEKHRYVHKGCGGAVTWDLAGGYCTWCHAEGLSTDDIEGPLCPGGCGCRLGTEDADRNECGCDGGCCE